MSPDAGVELLRQLFLQCLEYLLHVRIARVCKSLRSPGIDSFSQATKAGGTDSLESFPGFLKRWQIRALKLSRRLRLGFNVQHPIQKDLQVSGFAYVTVPWGGGGGVVASDSASKKVFFTVPIPAS